MKKILKRIAVVIITILIICSSLTVMFLYRSLPKTSGKIKLSNLKDKVEVIRDEKGVPSIIALNEDDLYFAQGFIQAQDRLFQMDLARRQASGRLSEIIGEAAIDNDKKFLVFSLRYAAEKSYPLYSEHAKRVLKSYADGVNAFIEYADSNFKLPYEFYLLGYKPEKWSEIDSLTIGKYMAYDLGGHWSYQAFNNWFLNKHGQELFKEMNKTVVEEDKDIDEIIALNLNKSVSIDKQTAVVETPQLDNGSNNWVLSGLKTKTKKPLLADDPHLSLSTPSIWYQMHLKAPGVDVSGVIFAGIPGIILGNNQDIAWGVTNYGPDVQDLYFEKQNPNNPYQFEYDGKYYDGEVKKYQLKVKNKASKDFEVVYTKNGPIINELLKLQNDSNQLLSMRWTALEATKELEAILNINKAKNWSEFENALLDFKAPAQNFVFADKNGNIAFKSNGLIPIRKKGRAILPVPGYLSEYAWEGYIDFEKLPEIVNPTNGYIASANTNTIEDYPYFVSNIWAQPYRKKRIDEVLSSRIDFTYQDMQKLQMDIENLYAREFLPLMLASIDQNKYDQKVIEILKTWDLKDDKNQAAPLIFHNWMIKYREKLFNNLMNEDVYRFMPHKEHYGDQLLRFALKNEKLVLIEKQGGIKNILQESLSETLNDLSNKYGTMEKWKWANEHRLFFQHSLTKGVPLLSGILNPKKYEISGSKITVQSAGQNKDGLVNHGASWRFVYDFSDDKAYHIVAPGQSGHFLSKYYKDQVLNWVNGNYHIKTLEIKDSKESLILQPEK